jgi:hypothetical protein
MGLFSKKKKPDSLSFDPEKEYPVLRCSICNGEQVAGFRNRATGHFTEVTLIRNAQELEEFKQRCNITEIAKEY